MEYSHVIKNQLRYFEARIMVIDDNSFLTIVRDITIRKKDAIFKEELRKILEMIVKNQPLQQIAEQIVHTVEELVENSIASILILDQEKGTLGKLSAPNLPNGFNDSIEEVAFGSKGGLFDKTVFSKKEVVVADIANDPLWKDYKELALQHGLKSSWSISILSTDNQVLGIFTLYCNYNRAPNENEKVILADASKLLSITIEQQLVGKSLIKSEERFRLAMLATHDGFYDFNFKNKTKWYNQSYNDLFSPTNGKNWWQNNIHPSDKKNVINSLNKALDGKSNNWISEYRLKGNDGSYVHIEDHAFIARNKQGEFERVLGAVADISKRKKAEQELIKSEQRLRNNSIELEKKVQKRTDELTATVQKLVETNLNLEDQIQTTKAAENKAMTSQTMFSAIAKNFPKGAIVVVDTNYYINFIKGAELTNFGLKAQDFEGVSINEIDVLSQEQKISINESIRRTLEGRHLSFEMKFENNIYEVNTTPLYNENKKINQALFVYNNISQHKQVELDILNALRKEQELNELKSRFISMASHEFRTPLSAILTSAILIEKQNEPGKEEIREKYAGKIKSNVRNLVVILNDFLSLSKLEEGKMLLQPEYFDLIDFSKSLIEEIETSKKEGQMITIINDNTSLEVNLDPKLIRHIVLNLVSNAIKYSLKNKEIIFRITSNKERIFLEVTDQGIGIPVEEQNSLFNRFFRAGNTSNIQGTGLGLYIVKLYTELVGGTISFKSELSEGTTFFVELPINQKKNEENIID